MLAGAARGGVPADRPSARIQGASVFSDRVGSASAAKMCRSVIVKGMEALLGESLLAARRYGVEGAVLDRWAVCWRRMIGAPRRAT